MPFARASGVLLHPTSLWANGGVGDLGPSAYAFADFLAAARQGVWQVLPLNPPGLGNSPYSAISAFAGNPLLISLDRLVAHGWLAADRLAALPPATGTANYPDALEHKLPLLFEAAQGFLARASGNARAQFDAFCPENAWWLEDFALFHILRRRYPERWWNQWPREFARRDPEAIAALRRDAAAEVAAERVIQFFFFEQWRALRRYCAGRSIRLAGDIAIFVSYDSADVWMNPHLFHLDENFEPTVVAGVPPDYFSETGQRWGNPIYRWDVMRQDDYSWWTARLQATARSFDYIRLDHFRGFDQYWEIPAGEPTAIHGHWVDGPKDDLFAKVRSALGGLPFFAEDLGHITPEVHALRERLGIPRMAVLQFGFFDRGAHIYLPHHCDSATVIYTGTHDTDTTVGWWNSAAGNVRQAATAYLGPCSDGIHWGMIRAAESSPASLCIIPVQDVLGLPSSARMNTPSVSDGNWTWRIQPEMLTRELSERLAAIVEVTDRTPEPFAIASAADFVA